MSIFIKLFGAFNAHVEGITFEKRFLKPNYARQKSRWLLALLALQKGAEVDRDWLVEQLWPDEDPRKTKQQLRNCLHDVRIFLHNDEWRISGGTRNSVRFDITKCHTLSPADGDHIDVVAFEQSAHDGLASNDVNLLEQCAELYQPDLLMGVNLNWTQSDWFESRRKALEALFCRVVEKLLELNVGRSDLDRKVRYLKLWLRAFPDDWKKTKETVELEAAFRIKSARDIYDNYMSIAKEYLDDEAEKFGKSLFGVEPQRRRHVRKPSEPQPAAYVIPRTPPANLLYIAPDQLLDRISNELEEHDRVAITGMPGIGKTEAAIAYAHQYSSRYTAVFWVEAASVEVLRSQYSGIAYQLGIEDDTTETNIDALIARVRGYLGSHVGWLLIFNNVSDLTVLRSLLPLGRQGEVIFTVRSSATGGFATSIELLPMAEIAGMCLFLRRANRLGRKSPLEAASPSDIEAARDVHALLGGLPLAIDQAGAFIERSHRLPSDFTQLYNECKQMLLDTRIANDTEHPESAWVTFTMAFRQIESQSREAADLLRHLSMYSPDVVPEQVFTGGNASGYVDIETPDELVAVHGDTARWELSKIALLEAALIHRNPETRTISMHRVTQDVIRLNMPVDLQEFWANIAVATIARHLPGCENSSWPLYRRLLPQLIQCVELIVAFAIQKPYACNVIIKTGEYLSVMGQYAEAEAIARKALLSLFPHLSPDDSLSLILKPKVALCRNLLAMSLMRQQRLPEAYEEAKAAYLLLTEDVTVNLRILLNVSNTLASCSVNLSDHTEAENMYVRTEGLVRAELQRLSGMSASTDRDHEMHALQRILAVVLNNRSDAAWLRGNPTLARDLAFKSLEVREAIQSTDDDLGLGYHVCAISLARLNQFDAAIQYIDKALACWRNAFNGSHPFIDKALASREKMIRRRAQASGVLTDETVS